MLLFSLRFIVLASIWQLHLTAQLIPHMGYFIEIHQMDCESNQSYINNFVCKVSVPRNRSLDASLRIVQKLNVLTGSLKVSIPNSKKVFTKIFDLTFDLCKTLRERKRKALLDLLVKSLNRGSNAIIRCPFGNGNYFSKNITAGDSLPPLLTETDFLVHFDVFIPKLAHVANVTVLGRLFDISKEQARKKKFL
ncbi:uncharacterized protein Dwil_GK22934 [Drosophila willistoni]|uniref:Uncharacterized protein n=1 Tax=Drosophila willistoni TaxID=7260 RepID=B4NN89_DROWI|nr:uncharacterized protein LOC6652131 [Drosophila willistoni]EDW85828.2 uncharacterized protein Dwil_GK22934 [Drosophila willistoni]